MTSDAFMKRLSARVAALLPVVAGDTMEAYAARVAALSRSAPVAYARIVKVARAIEDEMIRERRAEKDAWILAARRAFRPSVPAPCLVCGKYRNLAQAHHLVPLASQFERGFVFPDHDHVWLCPTHHVAIHALLADSESEPTEAALRARGRRASGAIAEMELEEIDVLLDLVAMSGWGLRR